MIDLLTSLALNIFYEILSIGRNLEMSRWRDAYPEHSIWYSGATHISGVQKHVEVRSHIRGENPATLSKVSDRLK